MNEVLFDLNNPIFEATYNHYMTKQKNHSTTTLQIGAPYHHAENK
jgi:hypothetical protein